MRALAPVATALLLAAGCGDSDRRTPQGFLQLRARWQHPVEASAVPATELGRSAGGDAFGPVPPASARVLQVVYADANGSRCCAVIVPGTAATTPSPDRPVVVLGPLSPGTGTVQLASFPSSLAPAPSGTSGVCPVQATAAVRACDDGGFTSPSFASSEVPVIIVGGAQTDAGDVDMPSFPFVVPGTLLPGPNSTAPDPVTLDFTVADAVSGVDPSTIAVEVRRNGSLPEILPIARTTPCNDRTGPACSVGNTLEVSGFAVTAGPETVGNGALEITVRADNREGRPLALSYPITAEAGVPTATPSATPTALATDTPTATPTSTVSATTLASATPTETPTATIAATETQTGTPTPIGFQDVVFVAVGGPTAAPAPALVLIRRTDPGVVESIPLPGRPSSIAIAPDRSTVYVGVSPSSVAAVDFPSRQVTAIDLGIEPLALPFGLAISPVAVPGIGRLAFAADFASQQVSVLDTTSNSLLQTLAPFSRPSATAVAPDGASIYVANFDSNRLSVLRFSLDQGQLRFHSLAVPTGSGPLGVAVAPNGTRAYVANDVDDTVTVIDPTAVSALDMVIGTITLPSGSGPTAVAFAPDSATAYVANADDDAVAIIDVAPGQIAGSVPVSGRPIALAVDPSGDAVYVVAAEAGAVAVVDAALARTDPDHAVTATVVVGDDPTAIAAMPLPGPAILCGDGIINGSETCDGGGTCVGGANHNQPCPPNIAGGVDCGDGFCRATGGDGCAANCTAEQEFALPSSDLPGFVQGLEVGAGISVSGVLSIRPGAPTGASGSRNAASPYGESFRPGYVPLAMTLADNGAAFAPIHLDTSPDERCLCLRAIARQTCGAGTQDLDCSPRCNGGPLDGQLCSGDVECPEGTCAASDAICPPEQPCDFVHGPGNVGDGTVDCAASENLATTVTYALSSSAPPPNTAVLTIQDDGPAGHAVAAISFALVSVPGACAPASCSETNSDKGVPLTTLMTTASGFGEALDVDGTMSRIGVGASCGGSPCIVTTQGQVFSCAGLASTPPDPGFGTFANAFAVQNLIPVGDAVITQQIGNPR